MSILTAKFGIFPTADNLSGSSLIVNASSGPNGETEEHMVSAGDVVAAVSFDSETGIVHCNLYEVSDGSSWSLSSEQPSPGDLVASIGASAPAWQRGSLGLWLDDGSFTAVGVNQMQMINNG